MKWYRMDSRRYADGVLSLRMQEFTVVGKTPKGVWLDVWGFRKWVSTYSKKRFAYPTPKQAKTSFRARKRRQIQLLTHQLAEAKRLKQMCDDGLVNQQDESNLVF